MELEYRRVSEGRTSDDLDFDPDTEAQIIESTRDCVLAIYAENADGVTTGNPVEGVVQGHQGRVISGDSEGSERLWSVLDRGEAQIENGFHNA